MLLCTVDPSGKPCSVGLCSANVFPTVGAGRISMFTPAPSLVEAMLWPITPSSPEEDGHDIIHALVRVIFPHVQMAAALGDMNEGGADAVLQE